MVILALIISFMTRGPKSKLNALYLTKKKSGQFIKRLLSFILFSKFLLFKYAISTN